MILPIINYGNNILRTPGKSVMPLTSQHEQLIEDMLETMKDAHGVGLAAQQIGQALQLAVVDISGIEERPSRMWIKGKIVDPEAYMPLLLLDPKIKGVKSKETDTEGCLSFPGLLGEIPRSQRIRVQTYHREGQPFEFEAGGLLGRAIQHEFDHLQGRLFIDLMDPEERKKNKALIQSIKEGNISSPKEISPSTSKKTEVD